MRTSHAPDPLARNYDVQLQRAEKLAATIPASKEVLTFHRKIVSFQKTLSAQVAQAMQKGAPAGRQHQFTAIRDSLDLALVLPHFRNFLSLVEQHAPKPLAVASRELAGLPSEHWVALLTGWWRSGGRGEAQIDPFTQFFPRAFLQPQAALLVWHAVAPPPMATPRVCPLCEARPLAGVLRPEGDGGKRFLICSFCGHEWEFRRILCPACGEEDEKKLPVYVAERFPHIRVECCETCKFFLRTIDLTKDGNAVPVVDDLAAIPLSLWAHEHAYTRLEPNLFGT